MLRTWIEITSTNVQDPCVVTSPDVSRKTIRSSNFLSNTPNSGRIECEVDGPWARTCQPTCRPCRHMRVAYKQQDDLLLLDVIALPDVCNEGDLSRSECTYGLPTSKVVILHPHCQSSLTALHFSMPLSDSISNGGKPQIAYQMGKAADDRESGKASVEPGAYPPYGAPYGGMPPRNIGRDQHNQTALHIACFLSKWSIEVHRVMITTRSLFCWHGA